jgi:AraC-like DNA-binding protein
MKCMIGAQAVRKAFTLPLESLAADSLIVQVAEALIDETPGAGHPLVPPRTDVRVLDRVRQFLQEERIRVVRSSELEAISGLSRYDLARQFRLVFGTSPYRCLLLRRLDYARQKMHLRHSLVEVAHESGFADQAHFTRMFKRVYGLTPACYAALRRC